MGSDLGVDKVGAGGDGPGTRDDIGSPTRPVAMERGVAGEREMSSRSHRPFLPFDGR